MPNKSKAKSTKSSGKKSCCAACKAGRTCTSKTAKKKTASRSKKNRKTSSVGSKHAPSTIINVHSGYGARGLAQGWAGGLPDTNGPIYQAANSAASGFPLRGANNVGGNFPGAANTVGGANPTPQRNYRVATPGSGSSASAEPVRRAFGAPASAEPVRRAPASAEPVRGGPFGGVLVGTGAQGPILVNNQASIPANRTSQLNNNELVIHANNANLNQTNTPESFRGTPPSIPPSIDEGINWAALERAVATVRHDGTLAKTLNELNSSRRSSSLSAITEEGNPNESIELTHTIAKRLGRDFKDTPSTISNPGDIDQMLNVTAFSDGGSTINSRANLTNLFNSAMDPTEDDGNESPPPLISHEDWNAQFNNQPDFEPASLPQPPADLFERDPQENWVPVPQPVASRKATPAPVRVRRPKRTSNAGPSGEGLPGRIFQFQPTFQNPKVVPPQINAAAPPPAPFSQPSARKVSFDTSIIQEATPEQPRIRTPIAPPFSQTPTRSLRNTSQHRESSIHSRTPITPVASRFPGYYVTTARTPTGNIARVHTPASLPSSRGIPVRIAGSPYYPITQHQTIFSDAPDYTDLMFAHEGIDYNLA